MHLVIKFQCNFLDSADLTPQPQTDKPIDGQQRPKIMTKGIDINIREVRCMIPSCPALSRAAISLLRIIPMAPIQLPLKMSFW
jgi:hypothetical protein